MLRKRVVLMCLVAFVAAGCAGLSVQSKAGTDVVLPDGSVVRPVGTFVQAEGTQLVSKDSYQCKPDKLDTAGKPVSYKDCTVVSSGNVGDDSPGAKGGKIAGNVGSSAVIAGGMVGAAAALRPSKVEQSGGGASATTGASTATANPTSNSGSVSTGAVTGAGASVNNNVGQ